MSTSLSKRPGLTGLPLGVPGDAWRPLKDAGFEQNAATPKQFRHPSLDEGNWIMWVGSRPPYWVATRRTDDAFHDFDEDKLAAAIAFLLMEV